MRTVLALMLLALTGVTAEAQQQTCSKLAAECVAFNKANSRGDPTGARCTYYKAECMRTGQWRDRNRSFDNVVKK